MVQRGNTRENIDWSMTSSQNSGFFKCSSLSNGILTLPVVIKLRFHINLLTSLGSFKTCVWGWGMGGRGWHSLPKSVIGFSLFLNFSFQTGVHDGLWGVGTALNIEHAQGRWASAWERRQLRTVDTQRNWPNKHVRSDYEREVLYDWRKQPQIW